MTRDRFDRGPINAIWDLETGRRMTVPAIDAKEFVERDPQRYVFAHPDDHRPPGWDESRLTAAVEVANLDTTAASRVPALKRFFAGLAGPQHAQALGGMMVTTGGVQALEALMHRFASEPAVSVAGGF